MQMPLTFRLVYHSLRALMRASVLLFLAWLFLIPATDHERQKLGVTSDRAYPTGLQPMRTAQAIVAVAPTEVYELISSVAAPDVPHYAIKFALTQMAAGNVQVPTATPEEEPFSVRDIEGPRFIRVD